MLYFIFVEVYICMANILSVLHMESDNDIRNQAATMEIVTIGNI